MLSPVSEVGGFTIDSLFLQLLYKKWRLAPAGGPPVTETSGGHTHDADG